jgi:hypothetical protein
MSGREMQSDMRPLCDRHLTGMVAVGTRMKMGGADVWTSIVFRCAEAGCARLFESGGYISASDGSIDPGTRNFLGCEDGAMFIESVEKDLLTWRCCKVGCELSRATDKAFHPIPQRFLRHLGVITDGPPDLSSRKGFSRQ